MSQVETNNSSKETLPPKTNNEGETIVLADGSILMRGQGEEDNTIRPANFPPEVSKLIKAGEYDLAMQMHQTIRNGRKAEIKRDTTETQIRLSINLDGTGQAQLATGVGFFDHMLNLLAKHSLIDLAIEAKGDLHVDAHHTVEDVGICFGKALTQALGDKAGIRRYGSATVPMDETLVTSALDLSGRPFLVWQVDLPCEMLGTFNASLAEEFWRAVSSSSAFNLHILCHHGSNTHHKIEAVFKATARALRQAVEIDPRMTGVPSTKGVL